MLSRRTDLVALAAAAVAIGSSLSCGSGKAAGPANQLFAQALAHFDAGVTAQSAGLVEKKAGNAAIATADFQTAQTEFTTARGLFDQIKADAAAYYGGRCSYELGLGASELAALSGIAGTIAQADFQDAVMRLDGMEAAYSGSPMLDRAAYFDGRARFHLAQLALDTYANARAQFQASLAANAGGTYADNAQYYLGRSWFEEGLKLVNVPVPPAPGSPDFLAATADFQNAETELRKVLSTYPSSTYVANARYYLGKTFFERPYDATVSLAGRIADLNAAIGWFDQVIASGQLLGAAHYWRGRSHYALAFDLVAPPAPPDAAELGAALLDVKAVQPPDVHADNALHYVAKAYVNLHVAVATDATGAYCTVPRPGDAPPASACDAYTALKTLSTTNASYAGSAYLAKTQSYIQTMLPSCACTW